MAFGNMAKAASSNAKLQRIALAMTNSTRFTISADKVTPIKGEPRMNVYSAQVGDVTILYWDRGSESIVKTVCW